jgi:hypothetical protein
MTCIAAIRASDDRMAVLDKGLGKHVTAMRTSSGIRIVKDFTDPTIVRKLSHLELKSGNWRPA